MGSKHYRRGPRPPRARSESCLRSKLRRHGDLMTAPRPESLGQAAGPWHLARQRTVTALAATDGGAAAVAGRGGQRRARCGTGELRPLPGWQGGVHARPRGCWGHRSRVAARPGRASRKPPACRARPIAGGPARLRALRPATPATRPGGSGRF